jgi:hypothetical protein
MANISKKIVEFLQTVMTNTVAANVNGNAIRFKDPDIARDTKSDFPCVSVSTFLEDSRENFGQKIEDDTYTYGSVDIIQVKSRIWALFGKNSQVIFNSNKISGTELLAEVTAEYINAFKKSESTLKGLLNNSKITDVPFYTDDNVVLDDTTTKPNKRAVYNELVALIEVRDKWS